MVSIVLFAYGLYFVLVGVKGNAQAFLTAISGESQFVYWIVALLIVGGLWETQTGAKIAKPMAVLIVLGFLLHNNNWQTIATNAKAVLPSASSTGA